MDYWPHGFIIIPAGNGMATLTPRLSGDGAVILLDQVSWQTYCDLREAPENQHVRMTFDQGRLYLMSPSRSHERIAELIGQLVIIWTEIHYIPRLSGGSTTMKSKLLKRGLEPDKCYYIQNEASARLSDHYDAQTDPPPDLAIEVDVTSLSTVRMPVYADLAVPEIWRWYDDQIEVYHLVGGRYHLSNQSVCLPGFPFEKATAVLHKRFDNDETSLMVAFRQSLIA